MSRLTRRLRGAWSGFTGTGAAASVGLALLVLACTFVGFAVPRASLASRTGALQQLFASSGAIGRTVTGTTFLDNLGASVTSLELSGYGDSIATTLRKSGLPLAARSADWSGMTVELNPVKGTTVASTQLELAYRDTLAQHAQLVSGSLPDRATVRGGGAWIQIAVTQATAEKFGLHVGSVLTEPGAIKLVLTGLVRPVDLTSAFWTVDPLLAAPVQGREGGALVGPDELSALQVEFPPSNTELSWGFSLALGHLSADQAPALRDDLASALNEAAAGPIQVSLGSTLIGPLAAFIAADNEINDVLALLFVSLTAIGLIVIVLGARLLSEYRAAEFTVLQARGASLWQLAWLALRGGSLAAIPAAIAGAGAATALTPGASAPLAWQLSAVTLAIALAGPPAIALLRHRALRGPRRRTVTDRPNSAVVAARRWVLDVAMVSAAAGGLAVLRQLGPPPAGGLDLYTSAAPVFAAIPAAIIVMRLYPVALRSILRIAGRRRGVTVFVGLARGSRTALTSPLPAFALVLALALVAFGATLRSAVERGDVLASWQTTGADAVVQASPGSVLSAPLRRSIATAPGVQRTAATFLTTGSAGQDLPLPVLEVSPAQYGALVAGTEAPAFPAALLARPAGGSPAAVPILISPAARVLVTEAGDQITADGHALHVRVAGTVASMAGVPAGSPFVVVPSWSMPAVTPNLIAIIGARLDGKALTTLIKRANATALSVALRSSVLTALANAPLPHGGYVAFAQGAAAAAGLSALILLLIMVLGARSRELTLARLSTMGLSRAQATQLSIVETVPVVLVAATGGISCALALVPLLAPAISLSAFTGSSSSVPVRADPWALAGSVIALLVVALLTLVSQAILASRRGESRALRVGE